MRPPSTYDKNPTIPISSSAAECAVGWHSVAERLGNSRPPILCVECYPGVRVEEVERALSVAIAPRQVFRAGDCLKPAAELDRMLTPFLTDDPVFGRMNGLRIEDFMDPARLALAREKIGRSPGLTLVIGTGAALLAPQVDGLVYADLARWEIQQRQRRNEIPNLGATNHDELASLKYKLAFFVDWRAADRLKKQLFARIDFLLDTNDRYTPRLISGALFRRALEALVERPFRLVPFFDPGPLGGEWMRKVCDLPAEAPNYAWCFDCVTEENSLRLGFGGESVEIPAFDLVFFHPRKLLGEAVHARFGTEFPIRFDFLDTMQGGNLSLQVHPLTEYIQDQFGMNYTQDESYYLGFVYDQVRARRGLAWYTRLDVDGGIDWHRNPHYQAGELCIGPPRDYGDLGLDQNSTPIYLQFERNSAALQWISDLALRKENWLDFVPCLANGSNNRA